MKLKNCQVIQIKQTLGKIVKLIGMNPENIKPEDFEFIAQHIKEDFTINSLTLDEMYYAFDLASKQRIDAKLETNKRLSPLYISNILLPFKRSNYYNKDKQLSYEEKRHVSTEQEKKSHFDWLLNKVFLEESERNGKCGEFPEVTICNWKDCYDYMLTEDMIVEKQGVELSKRLELVKKMVLLEDTNPRKSFSSAVIGKINSGTLPMAYYRFEVIDWFKQNKEQLTF